MKPGKYVGHKFTAEQEKARRIWRLAGEKERALLDALQIIDPPVKRDDWHKRLSLRLDAIEKARNEACGLFPDVDGSFVIASETIRF